MLVPAADTVTAALIPLGGTVLIAVAGWLGRRWTLRRRHVLRERRTAAGNKWMELCGTVTARLGTFPSPDDPQARRAALPDLRTALVELESWSQSELHSAFGRGSVIVCAERYIRELMKVALRTAETAVNATSLDTSRSAGEQLVELNSGGIDIARWDVFDAEFTAWRNEPRRDLRVPASDHGARQKLHDMVEQHGGSPIDCDLLL